MPVRRHANRPACRGIAMLLVLIAVAVASVLGMAFLASQSTSIGISENLRNKVQARAIADSGLEAALNVIRQDSAWRSTYGTGTWFSDQDFAGGLYTITAATPDGRSIEDPDTPVTLTALGRYEGVTHRSSVTVTGSVAQVLRLLLVVADANALVEQESARSALLQGWGFRVTPISQSASAADFNTAMADHDVVYLAPTCAAATVGSKLTAAPLGVVSELPAMDATLGLTSSAGGNHTSDRISIGDVQHYITAGFTAGTLTLTQSSQSLRHAGGTVAAGAQTLARRQADSVAALIALDASAISATGAPAAGRRVLLPWSGPGFDIRQLTTDGKLLMRRAAEWAAQPVAPDLELAHWTMDESAGAIAYDATGVHHGTYTNGPTLQSAAAVKRGVSFDGANDYVRVPHAATLNLTSQISLAAWVYPIAWTSNHRILQKGDSDNQYRLTAEGGSLKWDLRNVATLTATLPPAGQWCHVVATYNGQTMALYYNGQLVASKSASGSVGTTTNPLQIGTKRVGAPTSDYFRGIIDDVRLYAYGLSAAEARYLYHLGTPASTQDPPPQFVALYHFAPVQETPVLVGHWPLDEGGGGLAGGVAVSDSIDTNTNAIIDSFQSSKGAYGGSNVSSLAVISNNSTANNATHLKHNTIIKGSAYCGVGGDPDKSIKLQNNAKILGTRAALTQAADITAFPVPSPGNNRGAVSYTSHSTVNASFTCSSFTVKDARLTISGNITVLCTGNVSWDGNTEIVLAANSSLTLYAQGNIDMAGNTKVGMTTYRPAGVVLAVASGKTITMRGNTLAYAQVVAAGGTLQLMDNGQLFGSFRGKSLSMDANAILHQDLDAGGGSPVTTAANSVDSNHGTYGGTVTGQAGRIGSAANFAGSGHLLIPHQDTYLLDRGAVAFWFRTADRTVTQGLFSKDASAYATGGHLAIWIEASTVRARLQSTDADYQINAAATITNNTWHHVVLAFGPGGLRLYLDGSLTASHACGGGLAMLSGGAGNFEPIVLAARTDAAVTLTGAPRTNLLNGMIDDLRLYRGTFQDSHVTALFQNTSTDIAAAPAIVRDVSGYDQPADLYVEHPARVTWPTHGGMTIQSATRLLSALPAAKLRQAMGASNRLTLEIVFAPANVTQAGPARVLSYGQDTSQRNLAFGQDQAAYSAAVRTGGSSSAEPAVANTQGALTADTRQHVIVVYDGAEIRLYRNGTREATAPRAGSLASWSSAFHLAVGSETNSTRPWLGTLYRIALYDQALHEPQVASLFRGQPPGDDTTQPVGLIARWSSPE